MSRFKGYICPVCRKKFTDTDDIVVCPECGTPHHRECYLNNGKCALEEIHAHYKWNGILPRSFMEGAETEEQSDPGSARDIAPAETAAEEDNAADDAAGKDTPHGEVPLDRENFPDDMKDEEYRLFSDMISPYIEKYGGFYDRTSRDKDESPEAPLDSEVQSELRKILDMNFLYNGENMLESDAVMHNLLSSQKRGRDGVSMLELTFFTEVSLAHYVVPYVKFMRSDRKNGFNLSSGLFMGIHQFFRKMDGWGILMVLFTTAVDLIPRILEVYGILRPSVLGGVYIGARLLSFFPVFFMCLFGDKLYYNHAVRRIHKIRRYFKGKTDTVEYYLAIKDAGGISAVRLIFGLLLLVFSFVVVRCLPSMLA